MPLSYNQNKKHIYKWIENNRERWNELSRINMKKHYKYDDEDKVKKQQYYIFKKECKRLLNIEI